MGFNDPVAWGSVLAVIVAIAIFVFLLFKIKALMARDAENHKQQR